MTIPLLSTLREPPVPGRYYMVPVIDFIYCNREGQWPTLGPLHHDREARKRGHGSMYLMQLGVPLKPQAAA